MPQKSYLSTGELAEICSITKHTVLTAIEKGQLRASRTPGGHHRIHFEDARRFLEDHGVPITRLAGTVPAVLVVDDDTDLLQLIRTVLADQNVVVELASCGYDAGILAAELRPQVIVLDILLPDIDGRVICRQIKANPVTRHVKVLAISALKAKEEVESIFQAGCDDYLAKPFSIEDLKRKVLVMMRRSQKASRHISGSVK